MVDHETHIRIVPTQSRIDGATVIGISCGFAMIIAAIVLGGSPGSFINPPSVLIVIGGTLAITTACYSVDDMIRTFRVAGKTIFHTSKEPSDASTQAMQIAEVARKKGVLALQNILGSIESEPYLHKGILMVVDGTPGDEIESIMRRDLQATVQRHAQSTNVLRKMGEFAPAMGLIGTLIGLVQMLGNLDNPATIGPSMAVALLTTFYGAVLANMVFLPLAAKLEKNSQEEALINSVYMMAATSIGHQENPRRLEMLLNSILPPAHRIKYFD